MTSKANVEEFLTIACPLLILRDVQLPGIVAELVAVYLPLYLSELQVVYLPEAQENP